MGERIWTIIAFLFALAAAVLFWRNNLSAAFVTAALGAVAWFLSYRSQLRARLAATEHDSSEDRITEESDEN